ncbi:hypothetical protein AOL_s00007g140 [Orbilia oligospora ATCC 24927]|uniref:G domain-containing protein n=1 Tax=Arthrobotrys oligospora (strain ATCC 24927 / CBS 115.81 / DSM 1491) TaxID=756982 RepID=G1X1I1_ARTOA|nr:hypothetical protein AOL_s00007g140 [Orbilia oligospora ATCC 24927]EGX52804.1 hypothetical protein AOL_s00007g140 [Orbilia oligospora ATCC 24927]
MRQIRLFGAPSTGKKTLVGNLMMSCGLRMSIMEKLQRKGIQRYDRMTEFFIEENIPLSFETRSGPWEITNSNDPDVVLYLVDASASTETNIIDLGTAGDATIGILERCTRFILIVNKMDNLDWSAEHFQIIINRATSELQRDSINIKKFNSVAVSALHGDNIIQKSGDPMWRTLVQTLDLESIL